jgi:thioredoxin reductase
MIYDVLIVGGGPAGLSAALVLARCRRSVVVIDHGRPRNEAATAVHGFLGRDGVAPGELRRLGRAEAQAYGVEFIDAEATGAECLGGGAAPFVVHLEGREPLTGRKVLLATGVRDRLPEIENIGDFYGKSVHHCPYCDGWEHRERRLAALGDGSAAVNLALSLRTWSPQVTACTNGGKISPAERRRLAANQIDLREEQPRRLEGQDGVLEHVHFADGPPLPCDALFFANDQHQRSKLPKMLGCEADDGDLIHTEHKHRTCVDGVFVAGDADGDVQFAIVAAAEGAIAQELQQEDWQ